MAVAAELAQQRLGVPQRQMRFGRPFERNVTGEQRPPLGHLACGPRGDARQFDHTLHRVGVEGFGDEACEHPVGGAQPRVEPPIGARGIPRSSHHRAHVFRVEVEERRCDDRVGHGTHRSCSRREVAPGRSWDTESVGLLGRLGDEVDRGVNRFEGTPGLAGDDWIQPGGHPGSMPADAERATIRTKTSRYGYPPASDRPGSPIGRGNGLKIRPVSVRVRPGAPRSGPSRGLPTGSAPRFDCGV